MEEEGAWQVARVVEDSDDGAAGRALAIGDLELEEQVIDVFIRTTPSTNSALRRAMFSVTKARWNLEPVKLHIQHGLGIKQGRMLAEQEAESDPYIFTDDDVLIVGRDWVARAVSALKAHPEFGAVSSLSLIEGENLAKGVGEVYEMHAVGAPMIIRKGFMVNLPEMDLGSECGVIHKFLLEKGYKEGLVNGLRHNHMGHGFSSNPALFWGY